MYPYLENSQRMNSRPVGSSRAAEGTYVGLWTSEMKSHFLTAKTRKEPPSVLLLLSDWMPFFKTPT